MFTLIWTAVLENGTTISGTDGFAGPDRDDRLEMYRAAAYNADKVADRHSTAVKSLTITTCYG